MSLNGTFAMMQASSNANSFMTLTAPTHLPTLASPEGVDSPHLPEAHHSQANEVIGYTDIPPERQGCDFGQNSYFKYINNDNEILKSCTLYVQLAGLNANSGQGNNATEMPRYVDDVLNASFDHIEIQYGGNLLQTLYGDELHFRLTTEFDDDEYSRRCKLQGANLSDQRRYELAQNPQWLAVDLPFWWSKFAKMHWHQYAFQRVTRFIIYYRDVSYLLQQSVTNARPNPVGSSTYIMQQFLRFEITCPSTATKNEYKARVETRGDNGWLYMKLDWERLTDQVISAGTTNTVILLNTFQNYIAFLRFWIRPVANTQSNYLNNRRWQTRVLTSFSEDVSGKTYWPSMDDYTARYFVNAKKFLGNPENGIYHILNTDYPDVSVHSLGGFQYANTSNPTLRIITPAWQDDSYVDIYAVAHDYVRAVLIKDRTAAEAIE